MFVVASLGLGSTVRTSGRIVFTRQELAEPDIGRSLVCDESDAGCCEPLGGMGSMSRRLGDLGVAGQTSSDRMSFWKSQVRDVA